jgi:hypothetical protein
MQASLPLTKTKGSIISVQKPGVSRFFLGDGAPPN